MDKIFQQKDRMVYMDDMYKYYAVTRKKELYPLLYSVQERWNKNYHSILKWLLKIEELKD